MRSAVVARIVGVGGFALVAAALGGVASWDRTNAAVPPCTDVVPRDQVANSWAAHSDFVERLTENGARIAVEQQPNCESPDAYFVRVSAPILRAATVKTVLDSRPEGLGFAIALRVDVRE